MSVNDDLGKRMKEFYEGVPKTKLLRRTPVAIRIDGKAFHSFSRGFQKPFDEILMNAMQETTKYLCENIQGCVLGYTQSDEITLILVDYKRLNSSAWFDYEVQKMCSIAASMATMAFNKIFHKNIANAIWMDDKRELWQIYDNALQKGAMFDARCFNIPKEEVTNLIYWRQLDAIRNSIQMVGQANFSHKELQNKSCSDIKDMLMLQKGINWNDLEVSKKRGTCVINNKGYKCNDAWIRKSVWMIDTNIPIFKDEGRDYIEKLINCEEER